MSNSLDIIELVERLKPASDPTAPVFNAETLGAAMAEHMKQMALKMEAIAAGVVTRNDREVLLDEAHSLHRLADRFRSGLYQGAIVRADREKLMTADASSIIVAVGSLMYQTKAADQALVEVVRADLEKRRPDVSAFVTVPQD